MLRELFLPGFPDGCIRIGKSLSILKKDGIVTYFAGSDNFFSHPEGDKQAERFAFATLMENDHVRACDLEAPPLCIPHRTLMNWVRQVRKKGPGSFFRLHNRRSSPVMTSEKSLECGRLLETGKLLSHVASDMGVNESTLRKAVQRGSVPVVSKADVVEPEKEIGSTKAERSRLDAEAASGLGTACTRVEARTAAAIGLASCTTARFEPSRDVAMGGLLVGLPVLCANGLLSGIGKFLDLPRGFYGCIHILLTMGFMALGRIRRPEGLRHVPPGEFGKVVGLDRIPEVRTLREKITIMAKNGNPEGWMKALSKSWMEAEPDEAGYLYVDGHIRVYHGEKALLPRRYVSRERLCLRGTTDYWVNDAVGRPFFVVSKTVTEGLAETLLRDIVPELLESVPGQPSAPELDNDPLLHRFVIVFDREGANYALLASLWAKRIAAITYRKNVKDVWPESEFIKTIVPIPGGGTAEMKLAKRETTLSAEKKSIPVTEVRRLTKTGHQTAVITTARSLGTPVIAGRMFSRWCQENFFAYMMQHYDIDGLLQYGSESIPGTLKVVNPVWRELDKAVSVALRGVRRLQAKLGEKQGSDDAKEIQANAELLQDIQSAELGLGELRNRRSATPRKVTVDSLPEDQRPTSLLPLNKPKVRRQEVPRHWGTR